MIRSINPPHPLDSDIGDPNASSRFHSTGGSHDTFD